MYMGRLVHETDYHHVHHLTLKMRRLHLPYQTYARTVIGDSFTVQHIGKSRQIANTCVADIVGSVECQLPLFNTAVAMDASGQTDEVAALVYAVAHAAELPPNVDNGEDE
mmetsp:Transcript_107554/g.169765  ORF Transcript_107554/g.169765 Transcript_107554/m.169765 type:complete len:110 (+) Transcript_107554:73-402(+)